MSNSPKFSKKPYIHSGRKPTAKPTYVGQSVPAQNSGLAKYQNNNVIKKPNVEIIRTLKATKRAGLQSAKVTSNINSNPLSNNTIITPKIKNDLSSQNILPPIQAQQKDGSMNSQYSGGAQRGLKNSHTRSSEKYQFNESISTNATGLASNALHERSKFSNKLSNAVETPRGSDSSSKYLTITQKGRRKYSIKQTEQSSDGTSKRARSISKLSKHTKSIEKMVDGSPAARFGAKKHSQKPTAHQYPYSKGPLVSNHYIDSTKISHIKPISKLF